MLILFDAKQIAFDGNDLVISSSKFSVAANGDVSMTGEINATAGTIGPINLGSDGLTSPASAFNGTSSIDGTDIRMLSNVPGVDGTVGGLGTKKVYKLQSLQSGKVVEKLGIHYAGKGAVPSLNLSNGISTTFLGKSTDMKEDLGWFQDTYTNNNFGGTGFRSFIQIQLDTGSYNALGTPENDAGNLHQFGSTGIHLGYSDSTNFGFTSQAPLGSSYLGNTMLSLFNNGRISGSHDATFSAGTLLASSVVRSHGDVVAFYSSDERLKDNIRTIEEPIYKLRQLRGVEYEWNNKQNTYASGSLDSGIIAQDVQKVLPQLVKERHDGHLGVRHDRLVGLLVEAIKEQQNQIDELKEQVKELKDGSS